MTIQPQIVRAPLQISSSLFRSSFSVRGLPAAVEAKPHCGPMTKLILVDELGGLVRAALQIVDRSPARESWC